MNTAGREEGVKDALDKISAEITAAGGKVETVQKMDKKSFARVADKKHSAGFYANIIFSGTPALVAQLRTQICLERGGFPRSLHAGARTQTRKINPKKLEPLWPVSTKSSLPET